MAYPTICKNCLDNDCEHCEEFIKPPIDLDGEACGGGFCICGHGEPEDEWQKSVREQILTKEFPFLRHE